MAAAPPPAEAGVSVALPDPAASLGAHAWIAAAYAHGQGMLLVLNRDGVDALCRRGKSAFAQALPFADPPHTLRLIDEMQAAQGIDASALLNAALPRDPILLAEHDEDGTHVIELRVPLDLAHFPGHFAGAPVVPGAVQMAWALKLAASRLGTGERCHTMEALKFQQLLRPGASVTLTLRADHARGKLHFAYRHGEANYSSGRLVWSAAHA
jgi:3-hydroxymyristoyl/3-hydroxydecanoyl-(acyl carrier protein) dehydratase